MPRRTPRRAPETSGAQPAAVATRRSRGRTPLIADDQVTQRLISAIAGGVPSTAACDYAGLHPATFHRAMDAGRQVAELLEANPRAHLDDRQTTYRDFRDRVLRARAEATVGHVVLIGKVAKGGQLKKEVTRTSVGADGEPVRETEREYTTPDWRAAKFALQTGPHARDFVEKNATSVELTGADGGPLQVQQASEDVLSAISTRLAAVQQTQARQLEGGWDRPEDEDGVAVAELVDEQGDEW